MAVRPFRPEREVVEAKAHILLVDDETDFLFSAALALGKAGYRVSVAVNGEEALNLILRAKKERNPLRLLITDIRMPGRSGGCWRKNRPGRGRHEKRPVCHPEAIVARLLDFPDKR